MIYKLRKKLLWICCTSVVSVFTLIFIIICFLSTRMINQNMDMTADRISEGNGVFLPFEQSAPFRPSVDMDRYPGFFTEETPFSTRFFTVWLDEQGKIIGENIDSVSSVSKEQAREMAAQVLKTQNARGWKDNFRYKVFVTDTNRGIVFVDGSANRFISKTLMLISGLVLLVSMSIILLLIFILSKRAVRPIARTYEKQKQFVTDANHELKTPLTLILANLDIVESELGHSEWIDDIRVEGHRMGNLINQLTSLSRLDEEEIPLNACEFSISALCSDTLSEFSHIATSRGFSLYCNIQPNVNYNGDEGAVRQLIAILLDNAVKYCDINGNIFVSLTFNRQISFVIENDCSNVGEIEFDSLFDRFYRADKARTAGSGFGIGLSLAKSITERHHGEIRAYKAGEKKIGFKVILK